MIAAARGGVGLLAQEHPQLVRHVAALPARQERDNVGHVTVDQLVSGHRTVHLPEGGPSSG